MLKIPSVQINRQTHIKSLCKHKHKKVEGLNACNTTRATNFLKQTDKLEIPIQIFEINRQSTRIIQIAKIKLKLNNVLKTTEGRATLIWILILPAPTREKGEN